MIGLLENLHVALPEMVILFTVCLALLADLFLKRLCKNSSLIVACVGLLLAAAFNFVLIGNFKTVILSGLFASDDVAHLMKLFIHLSVLGCFIYSYEYLTEHDMPTGEFVILGLFSTLGMMVLVSANSMLSLYLGLELLSLPVYAMVALRRNSGESTEAALKYFVMGGLASGMLLYGISLLYGATGQLDLLALSNGIAQNWQESNGMIIFAMVFIVVGVGFKLAAVPFHMWAPDVYQGAPTPVTLFISGAPKIAAVGMALRLFSVALVGATVQWQQLILVMALLSTGLGNLVAVVQTNIKRLLAYSAVAHIGYALFGIVAATESGYASALYYILVYSIMSLAAFGLIVLLSRKGIEIESITDLKGLNKRNPWLAFMMMLVMFSMAGVPPTVGFFTKLLVLKALVDAHMTWVAVLGLFFAVIGAYYYIRIVKVMYFDEPAQTARIVLPKFLVTCYSVNCLLLLYWGIFPGVLINLCVSAFAP